MPFIEQPWQLFKLLKTQEIPAEDVRVGDVVLDANPRDLDAGSVAHVTEIDATVGGFLTLVTKVLTGIDDGYLRSILRKDSGDTIQIIDRSCLRHLPSDAGHDQGGDE